MVKFTAVKKAFKWLLILGIVLGIAAAAVPFVIPPLAEEIALTQLARIGLPFDVRLRLAYCWTSTGPGIRGDAQIQISDTSWKVRADFLAAPCQWHATVRLDETEFCETDMAIARLLRNYPVNAVSNMTFSGKVSFDAAVDRTFSCPVPKWTGKVRLRGASFSAVSEDTPIAVEGAAVSLGASGVADHIDIAPIFPRIESAAFGEYAVTNFTASIRATERALMVNEAQAAFWGGHVRLYSVFLDPKTFNAGLTLFLEDIDVGSALGAFKCFNGTATGRLHGKVKLFAREGGKGIRFCDAFLYSTPGEVGKIRMVDPGTVADGLALAGLDESNRANVANALADLDYSALKIDLTRESKDSAALNVRLKGSATRNDVTVPVTLDITLRGALEQLLNTTLKINNKSKGAK